MLVHLFNLINSSQIQVLPHRTLSMQLPQNTQLQIHFVSVKEDKIIQIIFPFLCPHWRHLMLKLLPTVSALCAQFPSLLHRHQLMQVLRKHIFISYDCCTWKSAKCNSWAIAWVNSAVKLWVNSLKRHWEVAELKHPWQKWKLNHASDKHLTSPFHMASWL